MRTDEAIRELTEVIKNQQGEGGGDGPSGGVFMVELDGESTDKTAGQIFQALANGLLVMVHSSASESYNRWEMALSIAKDDEHIGSSDYTTLRTSSWTFTASADDELLTLSE